MRLFCLFLTNIFNLTHQEAKSLAVQHTKKDKNKEIGNCRWEMIINCFKIVWWFHSQFCLLLVNFTLLQQTNTTSSYFFKTIIWVIDWLLIFCDTHSNSWEIVKLISFLDRSGLLLILCKGSFYGQNGHCSFILFSIDRNLSEFPYFYRTQVRSLPFLSVSQSITESLSLLRFDWWPTPRFIDTP